jgi:single-strand DNA-binding protein
LTFSRFYAIIVLVDVKFYFFLEICVMNKVFLKGNLTRDPEVRNIESNGKNTAVVNFTLAVSRYFRKANGDRDQETTFVNCEAWDSGAETIGKYLQKGSPLLVEGAIKNERWEDKETGQKRSRDKVRVMSFELLGGNRSQNNNTTPQAAESVETQPKADNPETPF